MKLVVRAARGSARRRSSGRWRRTPGPRDRCHGPSGMAAASARFRSATPSPVRALIMKTVSGFSRSREVGGQGEQLRLLSTRSTLLSTSSSGCWRCSSAAMMRSTSRAEPGGGVDDQQDQVGILARRSQAAATIARSSRRLRLEDARRVDQQDLRLALDRDAHQPRARGLRLGADDRDLLADQRIDQRRLAGVRRADHGDEAGTAFVRSLQLLQQRGGGRGFGLLLARAFGFGFAEPARPTRGP